MPSCSKTEKILPSSDFEYLDMSSFDDPYLLSIEDVTTFCEALERFDFYSDNGILKYSAASAKMINISERLYNYINELISKGNDPLTRTSTPNDCVARSLTLWGCSYQEINDYIIEQYGDDGVPSNMVFNLIKHFYPNAKEHSLDSNEIDFPTSIMTTVGYFATGPAGNAHMVNIASIDSTGGVTYYDAQTGSISSNEISDYYVI